MSIFFNRLLLPVTFPSAGRSVPHPRISIFLPHHGVGGDVPTFSVGGHISLFGLVGLVFVKNFLIVNCNLIIFCGHWVLSLSKFKLLSSVSHTCFSWMRFRCRLSLQLLNLGLFLLLFLIFIFFWTCVGQSLGGSLNSYSTELIPLSEYFALIFLLHQLLGYLRQIRLNLNFNTLLLHLFGRNFPS